MEIRISKKHEPREYSYIASNQGMILCDKEEGAFLILRFPSDITRLKELLDGVEITDG